MISPTRILEAILRQGMEQVEVMVEDVEDIHAEIKNSRLYSSHREKSRTLRVRSYWKKRKGIWKGEEWQEGFASHIAELTRASEPDVHFHSLPSPETCPQVEGLTGKGLSDLTLDKILLLGNRITRFFQDKAGDAVLTGNLSLLRKKISLVNSQGISLEKEEAIFYLEAEVIKWEKGEAGSAVDFLYVRDLSRLDWERLLLDLYKKARLSLRRRKLPSGVYPAVFSPLSTFLLLRTLGGSLDAESIYRKRSFMVGKLGEKIARKNIVLYDDPLIPGGIYSSPFDGEGVPHRRITLIDKGILQTYLHNSYTAHRDKVENTAHASPDGGISPTNLILERGKRLTREWFRDIDRGIYLDFLSLSPHPVSGDFSQPLDFAFIIEKGEIKEALEGAMVGGNFLRLLTRIREISSDWRDFPGNPTPSLLVDELILTSEA